MDFETYERTGRARYEELAGTVVRVLTAAMKEHGTLRTQQIQSRAKAPDSLQRKLNKAGAPEGSEIEPHAKDLAGVRLVFYTNSNVSQFLNTGIIQENFEVDWARTKIHHPTAANPQASELFVSNNYVVRLKDDRLALPEYSEFENMWCEVQVQTTLNHAWAEMAHDTIYKKPDLEGFGGDLLKGIEARMKIIMRQYLAPAGYAFDKVAMDFSRLSKGQELFEGGFVRSIEQSKDSSELHETITTFTNSVLSYIDSPEAVAEEIILALKDAIKRSRGDAGRPIETPFGNIAGKSGLDVAEAAAQLIRNFRFINPEQVFSDYCNLYSAAEVEEERQIWIDAAAGLAEHHIQVWEQAGPAVQGIIMTIFMSKTDVEKLEIQPLILAVLPRIFATDMSGATTQDADSIVFHRGAVVASGALKKIRSDALSILHVLYRNAEDVGTQKQIIEVYRSAMALPNYGAPPTPELAEIVFGNSVEIIRNYVNMSDEWPFELRQKVEHDLLWQYRYHGEAPPNHSNNLQANTSRELLVAAILQFRDHVNSDEGFTTYKLLVGFESVFPPAWDDQDFDYEAEEVYRNEQIQILIEGITPESAVSWRAIIDRCAATESNDAATFPAFGKFLEDLAIRHPAIVLGYLETIDDRLAAFLASMLLGLAQTDRWDATYALLDQWRLRGEHLRHLSWVVGVVDKLSIEFLSEVARAAIASGDTDAVFNIVKAISSRDNEDTAGALKNIFLAAVNYMSVQEEPRWVNVWWSRKPSSALLDLLDAEEAQAVLQSIIGYEKFKTQFERFLTSLAATKPDTVIAFLGARVRFMTREARQRGYEALPYSLNWLRDALAPHVDVVLDTARTLFTEEPEWFQFRGARLVKIIFPAISMELEVALGRYIEADGRGDIAFAVALLRVYSGEDFIYPLCKAAIAKLPVDDPLLSSLEVALEQMGVTSGASGRGDALKIRREAIAHWAEDANEPVRQFTTKFIHHLDQQIAAEQRRREEQEALRRLEYDQIASSEEDGDDDGGDEAQ